MLRPLKNKMCEILFINNILNPSNMDFPKCMAPWTTPSPPPLFKNMYIRFGNIYIYVYVFSLFSSLLDGSYALIYNQYINVYLRYIERGCRELGSYISACHNEVDILNIEKSS